MSQVIALGPGARMLTTREAALRLGVSLRTVQLWVEASILPAARTPGGHRRIPYNAVEALAMSMGLADAEPVSALRAVPVVEPVETPELAHPQAEAPAVRMKLLLVSRDAAWLQGCLSALEVFGAAVDVQVADNGYVALLMVGRDAPDLLVTTLELPGMDGLDMLRTLERCEVLPRLEAIALLPSNELPAALAQSLPGGVQVLYQPVSPEALAIRAGRCLLQRQAATQGAHHE
jgi:excisionase family DNA binding protein